MHASSKPGPSHSSSRPLPFAEQSTSRRFAEQKRGNRFSAQSESTSLKPVGINALGKHVYPLLDLCNDISRKEYLQRVRILRCESYTEGLLPPHIYLVLPLCDRRHGDASQPNNTDPNAWLRLDRRRAKGSLLKFIFASSRTVANDQATLAGERKHITELNDPDNRQHFEHPITLQELGVVLKIVCEELLNYKLICDNCWAFSSIIEDCLHTLYKSTFTIGDVKNRWIATKRREHILANARAKSEKTTEADEATMEQIIHQANEAKAGIIRGLVDALLEWCKQHGGSAAQTSHRPIYDPSAAPPSPSPRISSINPNTGPTVGGIDVTINGSHFHQKHTCFFGTNGVDALRQDGPGRTLKCKMPPSTEPGPVYVALDRPAAALEGSATGRPNDAAVFTYEDENPLQEILTILQSCTHELNRRRRSPATALSRLVSKWVTRKVPLTLDASKAQVECLATEVVKLVEEKYTQDPELVLKSLLRATSKSNRTLVHLSAMLGFDELLGNVISHGADLNQPDTSGYTPLHYAARQGHGKSAQLLVERGASADVLDRLGRPAENVAKDSGHSAVEGILKERRRGAAATATRTASPIVKAPAPRPPPRGGGSTSRRTRTSTRTAQEPSRSRSTKRRAASQQEEFTTFPGPVPRSPIADRSTVFIYRDDEGRLALVPPMSLRSVGPLPREIRRPMTAEEMAPPIRPQIPVSLPPAAAVPAEVRHGHLRTHVPVSPVGERREESHWDREVPMVRPASPHRPSPGVPRVEERPKRSHRGKKVPIAPSVAPRPAVEAEQERSRTRAASPRVEERPKESRRDKDVPTVPLTAPRRPSLRVPAEPEQVHLGDHAKAPRVKERSKESRRDKEVPTVPSATRPSRRVPAGPEHERLGDYEKAPQVKERPKESRRDKEIPTVPSATRRPSQRAPAETEHERSRTYAAIPRAEKRPGEFRRSKELPTIPSTAARRPSKRVPAEAETERMEIPARSPPAEAVWESLGNAAPTSSPSYAIRPPNGRERPSRPGRVSERPARQDPSQPRSPHPSERYEEGKPEQKGDDQVPRKRRKERESKA